MAGRAPFVVATCAAEGKGNGEDEASQDSDDPLSSLVAAVEARNGLLLLVGDDEQALVFVKRWLNTPSHRGGPQAQSCRSGLLCAKSLSEVKAAAGHFPDNVAVALVVRVDDPPTDKFTPGSPLAAYRAYFDSAATRGELQVVLVPGTAAFAERWVAPEPRTRMLRTYVPRDVCARPTVLYRLKPSPLPGRVKSGSTRALGSKRGFSSPPTAPPCVRVRVLALVGRLTVPRGCLRGRGPPPRLSLTTSWARDPAAERSANAGGGGGGGVVTLECVHGDRRPKGVPAEYDVWTPVQGGLGADPGTVQLPLRRARDISQQLLVFAVDAGRCQCQAQARFGSKSLRRRVMHVDMLERTRRGGGGGGKEHVVTQANVLMGAQRARGNSGNAGRPDAYAGPSQPDAFDLALHVEVGAGATMVSPTSGAALAPKKVKH